MFIDILDRTLQNKLIKEFGYEEIAVRWLKFQLNGWWDTRHSISDGRGDHFRGSCPFFLKILGITYNIFDDLPTKECQNSSNLNVGFGNTKNEGCLVDDPTNIKNPHFKSVKHDKSPLEVNEESEEIYVELEDSDSSSAQIADNFSRGCDIDISDSGYESELYGISGNIEHNNPITCPHVMKDDLSFTTTSSSYLPRMSKNSLLSETRHKSVTNIQKLADVPLDMTYSGNMFGCYRRTLKQKKFGSLLLSAKSKMAKGQHGRKETVKINETASINISDFISAINELPHKHLREKIELQREIERNCFINLKVLLINGFSVLLYGFGSKIRILDTFVKYSLLDGYVCILRGYKENFHLKDPFLYLLKEFKIYLPDNCTFQCILRRLVDTLKIFQGRLYFVIHSIDNVHFKEHLSTLSTMATLPNVYIIASVDLIIFNTIFDSEQLKNFNFVYQNCNTYFDYREEIQGMYESYSNSTTSVGPIWMRIFSTLEESGQLKHRTSLVLNSLTTNHRRLFKLIAEVQIKNSKVGNRGVMKNEILTSLDAAPIAPSHQKLNLLLQELFDHKILKERSLPDGSIMLYIPLSKSVVTELLLTM